MTDLHPWADSTYRTATAASGPDMEPHQAPVDVGGPLHATRHLPGLPLRRHGGDQVSGVAAETFLPGCMSAHGI